MPLGVDLGATRLEAIALNRSGRELLRKGRSRLAEREIPSQNSCCMLDKQ